MGEVEIYFFILWLSDNVDTLSVADIRVRPERGHDNSFTICVISSATWTCYIKKTTKSLEIFTNTVTSSV